MAKLVETNFTNTAITRRKAKHLLIVDEVECYGGVTAKVETSAIVDIDRPMFTSFGKFSELYFFVYIDYRLIYASKLIKMWKEWNHSTKLREVVHRLFYFSLLFPSSLLAMTERW